MTTAELASWSAAAAYPDGAPSPCCAGERLIADPEYIEKVLCPECGTLYDRADP